MRRFLGMFFSAYFHELAMGTARIFGMFIGALVIAPFVYLYGRYIMGWWQ